MDTARAENFDLAKLQLETLLKLGMEGVIRQGDDTLRILRRLGPHDRRPPPFERQDRERPRRQKMLFRAALMIALVPDIDNDRRLAVIPAVGGDAGVLPDRGARAVSGYEEARARYRAVGKFDDGQFRRHD